MAEPKSQLPLQVSDISPVPPHNRANRSSFHFAYLLIWVLMVLSAAGAYGLDNGSTNLLTTQLAVLGALAVGAFLVWIVTELSRSNRLRQVCYPLLYLWAVLCYAVQDERFVVRLTNESYSGSTASAAVPAVVLFLFLPGSINKRFTPCLISGLGGLAIITAFQSAGLRANAGLAETSLALIAVLFVCRDFYKKRNLHHSLPSGTILPANKAEAEPETWGLTEDCRRPDMERTRRKLHEVYSLLTSLVHLQGARDTVKLAMNLVQEAGKDLSSLVGNYETGSAGLVSKAVESEYRMHQEEQFLPEYSQTSKPVAHPIEYGGQELVSMLNQLETNWNFDMFSLAQVSGFRVLEVTGEYCIKKYTLDTNLQLNETQVVKFLQEMERKYKPNPYHNSTHASDVLNSLLFLYSQSNIFKEITELELFGSIIAALGHDVGHPAFTNRYLINTKSQFAVLCNY